MNSNRNRLILLQIFLRVVTSTALLSNYHYTVVKGCSAVGDVMERVRVRNRIACTSLCSTKPRCVSTNYETGHGVWNCELMTTIETELEYSNNDKSYTYLGKLCANIMICVLFLVFRHAFVLLWTLVIKHGI